MRAKLGMTAQHTLRLPGLHQTVRVRFDDRRVPHSFALNDHDLYYAQGYITAQDRLWQMDFITHVAAGRLALPAACPPHGTLRSPQGRQG